MSESPLEYLKLRSLVEVQEEWITTRMHGSEAAFAATGTVAVAADLAVAASSF